MTYQEMTEEVRRLTASLRSEKRQCEKLQERLTTLQVKVDRLEAALERFYVNAEALKEARIVSLLSYSQTTSSIARAIQEIECYVSEYNATFTLQQGKLELCTAIQKRLDWLRDRLSSYGSVVTLPSPADD